MYPNLKHLRHFVLEGLVGDLGVEVEGLSSKTFIGRSGFFWKMEGEVFVEMFFLSFPEDL